MKKIVMGLEEQMYAALKEIAITARDGLAVAERSYKAIGELLGRLNEHLLRHEFQSADEEIIFFKEWKPVFLKEYLFYLELYHFELYRPVGSRDELIGYCQKSMFYMKRFLERNEDLYRYYRAGRTDLDAVYFVRGHQMEELHPEIFMELNPACATVHSFRLAKLQAYEQMTERLVRIVDGTDFGINIQSTDTPVSPRNVWTESKAALIELAYAIHSRGAVNHGQVDVKQIISALEELFSVKLGNFYRVFQGIRIRKKNRTAFLDNLKESLERRMDETDLDYRV